MVTCRNLISQTERQTQRQTDRGSAPQIRGDTIRYDMDKMMMMMIRSGGIWRISDVVLFYTMNYFRNNKQQIKPRLRERRELD